MGVEAFFLHFWTYLINKLKTMTNFGLSIVITIFLKLMHAKDYYATSVQDRGTQIEQSHNYSNRTFSRNIKHSAKVGLPIPSIDT